MQPSEPQVWDDDAIIAALKARAATITLPNGWHVISLIAAANIVRMVRDDLERQLASVTLSDEVRMALNVIANKLIGRGSFSVNDDKQAAVVLFAYVDKINYDAALGTGEGEDGAS